MSRRSAKSRRDKLNAARLRRGRPAIPPLWKVGPSPIVEIYTTKIVPAQMHGRNVAAVTARRFRTAGAGINGVCARDGSLRVDR